MILEGNTRTIEALRVYQGSVLDGSRDEDGWRLG